MPTNDIMNLLDVASCQFQLQRLRDQSRDGSGRSFTKDLAPPIWGGQVQSNPYYHDDAAQIMTLIEDMEDQMGSFYVWNPAMPFPQADPKGTLLGNATPTIASINADNKRFGLTGLPSGYVLTRGDKIAVDYASGTRRALYSVVDAVATADGAGAMAQFKVSPFIRTGTQVGNPVVLAKPGVNMKIVPNTLSCAIGDGVTSRISFQMAEQP